MGALPARAILGSPPGSFGPHSRARDFFLAVGASSFARSAWLRLAAFRPPSAPTRPRARARPIERIRIPERALSDLRRFLLPSGDTGLRQLRHPKHLRLRLAYLLLKSISLDPPRLA